MSNTEHKGRGRPREFDKAEVLGVALKIFWEKGYEPTSIAEICAATNLVPPSLYAAFGNKSSLFLEAVRYYEQTYWAEPAAQFMAEENLYKAVEDYFQKAARIILSPEAPCGCMAVLSGINISEDETEIIAELKRMRQANKNLFIERMRKAIQSGEIPADTDVPAIAGALAALLEGMSLQAREGLFLSELKAIASLAPRLLPPEAKKSGQVSSCLLTLL